MAMGFVTTAGPEAQEGLQATMGFIMSLHLFISPWFSSLLL